MNIFATSIHARKSARALDNKRLVKMCLESAQLLSTAMVVRNAPRAPYKATHRNHPCSIWCRTNAANYLWLISHFTSLCDEYHYRYGKIHKCKQYLNDFYSGYMYMPHSLDMTPFPNCTIFKEEKNTFKAYKKYLLWKWENDKIKPRWTNRRKPRWKVK